MDQYRSLWFYCFIFQLTLFILYLLYIYNTNDITKSKSNIIPISLPRDRRGSFLSEDRSGVFPRVRSRLSLVVVGTGVLEDRGWRLREENDLRTWIGRWGLWERLLEVTRDAFGTLPDWRIEKIAAGSDYLQPTLAAFLWPGWLLHSLWYNPILVPSQVCSCSLFSSSAWQKSAETDF